MYILVTKFYCMLLHIAIDRMKRYKTGEDCVFTSVLNECKNEPNILVKALKMDIYHHKTSEFRHRTPFQHLIENQNVKVNASKIVYHFLY